MADKQNPLAGDQGAGEAAKPSTPTLADQAQPFGEAGPDYFRDGWSPLPLPYGQKASPPSGFTGVNGHRPSKNDVGSWAAEQPDSNVCLRLPADVIGIDVDAYGAKHGGDTLAALEEKLGPLPATVRSTARPYTGNIHGIRLFRVQPTAAKWHDAGECVETISAGYRYMLVQPSAHPSGDSYVWVDDRTGVYGVFPTPGDLPDLPQAWVEHLQRGPDTAGRPAPEPYDGPAFADLPEAEQWRLARYTDATVEKICEALQASKDWPAGFRLKRDPDDPGDPGRGWERFQSDAAYRLAGLARAAWSPLTLPDAARAFISSAPTDAGWTREDVESKWDTQSKRAKPAPYPKASVLDPADPFGTGTPAKPAGTATDPPDDLREGMHHGQLRMAYRLVGSKWRTKLLYVHGVGWHWWDGRRWAEDDQGHAVRAVRNVLRRALATSLDMNNEDAAKAIRRDVDKCSSAAGAAGVLTLAASMAPFAATIRDLDADPYLLNCANGTLDMRTMQLRPHDPADRITKVTRAAYRDDADPAEWAKFLDRVLPDPDVREFLQRVAGVALLGRVVEHVLAILTGVGANGKGCFTRAVEHALGDYAATAESELFLHREHAHPTGEMDLRGRRWVSVSENDRDRRLAEATMKRLTGGDTIKARRMRQDFVEFQPSHTALLVTNHLPKVRGDDPAIWRRVRVIPFDVVILEEERDKKLDEKLQLHADAVLGWAVAGWADYDKRGDLDPPDAVKVATEAYQLDSDAVARFLEDECIEGGEVKASDLYRRWQQWAAADGAPEMSAKAFGQALDRKGYKADRTMSARIRLGLTLANTGGEHDA